MVDDFFDPAKPEQDCHSCECAERAVHKIIEFIIDPGSNELSASRACFIWLNVIGSVVAVMMCIGGLLGVQGAFAPAAAIVTGLVASDSGVYFASTRKGYECNK